MAIPVFFNAHHSPVGGFASFTLGQPGPKGGLGLELGKPADQAVFIGVEDAETEKLFHTLPFFGSLEDASVRYDVEGLGRSEVQGEISHFPKDDIRRNFLPATDTWTAGDLTFRILTPIRGVPDPETGSTGTGNTDELKDVLCPAVWAELTIDNRAGSRDRIAFFGYGGNEANFSMRYVREADIRGVAAGLRHGIFSDDPSVVPALGWQPELLLLPDHPWNEGFMLGSLGLLKFTVPAGEQKTVRFAIAFHRDGTATAGLPTRYTYLRWFRDLESVARHALAGYDQALLLASSQDSSLGANLSKDRRFMLSHAIRSYYGSTQLLDREDGRPIWMVNEGEYRMMNTFDLTADQLFFELQMNPWTVRNELDLFVERYSYRDQVRFPGDETLYPGGLAFTHDMGVTNCFSAPGRSSYEKAAIDGCFSHMTHEELVNWALCAVVYLHETKDLEWAKGHLAVFQDVLESLENRDHPDPAKRDGIMSLDSDRTAGGAEITTYDSLDASLGQARHNLYLAVKTWATYRALERFFDDQFDHERALRARKQALLAAQTIVASADEDGKLPAVLFEGVDSRIIPAIEGLAFPYLLGDEIALEEDGPYGHLIGALRRHFEAILVPGECKFADGAWKLSSTSDNSWLSKIYLCQFVAERVLGFAPDEVADAAHVGWLTETENAYWAWSDQILAGQAVGSRYYPRGVTSILWTR